MKLLRDKLFTPFQYIRYVLRARYRNGHGVHSPFVYDLVTNVICNSGSNDACKQIEALRKRIKKSKQSVVVEEYGGGSKVFKGAERKLSDLLRYSSIKKKYGNLISRYTAYYQPECVLELGTSIGLSTAYMRAGMQSGVVHTVEANKSLIDLAKSHVQELGLDRISFHHGTFEDVLDNVLANIPNPDLVFIDGNHTYEATLDYFNTVKANMTKGVIILDDIYWSEGMMKAWQEIQAQSDVCIDIFQFGIVVIHNQITPGNYRVSC